MSKPGGGPQRHGDRWSVQLFGGLRLANGGLCLDHWPDSVRTRLLARLLLDPSPQPRDELAAWLWPVDRPRKGRVSDDPRTLRLTRLRNELKNLNGLLQVEGLPPGGALLKKGGIQLNPAAFDSELLILDDLLREGRLDEAAALLDRGLLPALHDPWLDGHRARLRASLAAARLGLSGAPARPSHELPLAGRFFGRRRERALLLRLLQSDRLISITGAGGTGKTRLAHEAYVAAKGFGTQAFVALAPLRDSSRLLEHIRDTLQIQPGAQEPLKQLTTRLSGQRALLVLDNFEQLADEAGEQALLSLLEALPHLHVVLTSTRALHTPRCRTLLLDSLPLPAADCDLLSAQVNPAVALFVERAAEVRPGFKVTSRNRASVIAICRAVDGLPLALELAALRVRQVSPSEMAQALQRDYRLLARRDPGARRNPRHASLQAVLDWSFSLQAALQQKALMQLAPLRGAFTAEQAAYLLTRLDARPVLDALLRDSLLRCQPDAAGRVRWSLPPAHREYAAERSPRRLASTARRRHRECFARLAADSVLQPGRLTAEDLPDLVVAGAAALGDGLPETAVSIALALARHAAVSGTLPEALDFLQQVAQEVAPEIAGHPELRARLPPLFVDAGRSSAAQALAERALAQAGSDPLLRALALFAWTHARWRADRDGVSAMAGVLECLRLARRTPARLLQARVLALAGALKLQLGRGHRKAMASFTAAGRRFGESGDPLDALRIVPGVTACLLAAGEFELAARQAAEAEHLAVAAGDIATQLLLCNRQGEALGELRFYAEALVVNRRQVQVARRHGMNYHLSYGLWNQCLLLVKLREPVKAALLMGFSQRYWESQFEALNAEDRRYVSRVRRLVIAQTSPAEWRRYSERGAALDDAEAMRLGSE